MSSTTTTTEESSSSAEIIGGNQDLLTQLLIHLPTKPLLRLKSTNKLLFSLLSHPHLSVLHSLRHSLRPSSALFLLPHHFIPLSTPLSPPPFFSLLPSFRLLQSSRGLLLCSPSSSHYCMVPNHRLIDNVTHINNNNNNSISNSFYIVNPTTGQITPISILPRHYLVSGLALAFDPLRSPNYYIVCVYKTNNDDEDCFLVDVYSSGSGKWREAVAGPFEAPFDVEFERGVYCEGMVHWLSHTEWTIVLDLGRECVERLGLPKGFEGDYMERFRYFGESCGHLHLVEIRTNCVAKFEVLELDARRMEWFVKFRVDLDVVGLGFEGDMFQDHCDRFGRRFRFYAISILAVIRGNERNEEEDDEGSMLVVSVPGKVIAYHFKTKESRLICNVVDESDRWLPFKGYNAYQYIESLYHL